MIRVTCGILSCLAFSFLSTLAEATPPGLPASVQLEAAGVPEIGGSVPITLTVTAEADLKDLQVSLSTTGDLILESQAVLPLGDLVAGAGASAAAQVRLTGAGNSTLKALVIGRVSGSTAPATAVAEYYFVARYDEVLYGRDPHITLEIKHLQARRKAGTIDRSDYDARVSELTGGGAVLEDNTPRPKISSPELDAATAFAEEALGISLPPAFKATPKANITISGQIQWTDGNGGLHPARFVRLQLIEVNGSTQQVLTEGQTDLAGQYTFTVNNDDPEGAGGRDMFLAAFTDLTGAGTGVQVYDRNTGNIYNITSGLYSNVSDNANFFVNLTANNTDTNNRAFGIFDALFLSTIYVNGRFSQVLGVPVVGKILAEYPGPNTTNSFFNPTTNHLEIRINHWNSWDLLHHEYGHFVTQTYNLRAPAAAAHWIAQNMSAAGDGAGGTLGKLTGMQIAWGEGWPTFFGTRLQQSLFAINPALNTNVPSTGDTFYTDFGGNFSYDLEGSAVIVSGVSTGQTILGEDCEGAVQRALYDFADGGTETGDTIQLSTDVLDAEQRLFQVAFNASATTFDAFFRALTSQQFGPPLGEVLEMHGLGSRITGPQKYANYTPFQSGNDLFWQTNAAPTLQQSSYVLEFWTNQYGSKLLEIGTGSPTSAAITGDSLATIWNHNSPYVFWFLRGTNTQNNLSTTYFTRTSTIGGLRMGVLIDNSASMADELVDVKRQFNELFDFLGDGSRFPTEVVLVNSGAPFSLIASTSIPQLRAAINGISVSTGEEPCERAILDGVKFLEERQTSYSNIFVATDASDASDTVLGGLINTLKAKNVYVSALVTGACSGTKQLGGDALGALAQLVRATGGALAYEPSGVPSGTDNTVLNLGLAANGPAVISVEPNVLPAGSTAALLIRGSGTNFTGASTVSFSGTGIAVDAVQGIDASTLMATVTVAADAAVGAGDVIVTSGDEVANGLRLLEITGPSAVPSIIAVQPATISVGAPTLLEIFGVGTNFSESSTLTLNFEDGNASSISIESLNVNSPTQLAVTVTANEGDEGAHDVVVTTGGEVAAESMDAALLVVAPVDTFPDFTAATPSEIPQGGVTLLTITGRNNIWQDAVTQASVNGDGILVDSTKVINSDELQVWLQVAEDAPLGPRDLTLTT
ncbi:MAG: VWA domain-containing protein, partial [Candidatus Hydrogenedentes bacterium]|nr:VWA domain-containing protein [Candidatus Hydrogenedentota bacterium]